MLRQAETLPGWSTSAAAARCIWSVAASIAFSRSSCLIALATPTVALSQPHKGMIVPDPANALWGAIGLPPLAALFSLYTLNTHPPQLSSKAEAIAYFLAGLLLIPAAIAVFFARRYLKERDRKRSYDANVRAWLEQSRASDAMGH
jgi:hypothetical protein